MVQKPTLPYEKILNLSMVRLFLIVALCLQFQPTTPACPPPSPQPPSPPTTGSCFLISNLPLAHYAGNGLYCSFPLPNPNPTSRIHHYTYTSTVSSLRYELRISTSKQKSWVLVKVEADQKSNRFIGTPIYQSKLTPKSDRGHLPPLSDWVAVRTKPNDVSSYMYDKSEPELIITEVDNADLRNSHKGKLAGFEAAKQTADVVCLASLCEFEWGSESGSESDKYCVHEMRSAGERCMCRGTGTGKTKPTQKLASLRLAQLSELSHNFTLAQRHYTSSLNCLLSQLEQSSPLSPLLSRYKRWEISTKQYDVARMKAKQGDLSGASDTLVLSLAHCPDEYFRRQLYIDYGDLNLAMGDFDAANQAYVTGRDSVRTVGGR